MYLNAVIALIAVWLSYDLYKIRKKEGHKALAYAWLSLGVFNLLVAIGFLTKVLPLNH